MAKIILITIRICISVILAVTAYRYTLVYNLHMFQLNGYKNREHASWLKKYKKRQWVLGAAIIIGVLGIFLPCAATDIIALLWFLLVIAVYQALCGMSQKKPLVYTARVKRLVATVIVLDVLAVLVCVALWGVHRGFGTAAADGGNVLGHLFVLRVFFGGYDAVARLDGILLFIIGVKFISCIVANIVNSPIEKGVNRHFINDAKRKLVEYGDPVVIGVTGSYGKTSVKYYLGELLKVKYNVCITPESYNTPMGVVRTVREHMKPGTEVFVCEMGARHVGDIKELCDLVHPDHGIITSVGPQHLETFFTMDNIIGTKFELADAIPSGGMLFLNGDNEYIAKKASHYNDPVMYHARNNGEHSDNGTGDMSGADSAGSAGASGYNATNVTLTPQGTSFDIVTPEGETESYQMSLIGSHNLINVTGAIAVAHKMGIALKDLKIPVRRLKSVPHRLEMKRQAGICVIDDAYNSNPAGSSAALDTLAMFDGTLIMITPGMVELGEKEEEYNREFGKHAAQVCDHLLLVGKKRAVPIREGAMAAIVEAAGAGSSGLSESGQDTGTQKLAEGGSGTGTIRLTEEHISVYDRFEDAWKAAMQIRTDKEKYILLENDLPDNY